MHDEELKPARCLPALTEEIKRGGWCTVLYNLKERLSINER